MSTPEIKTRIHDLLSKPVLSRDEQFELAILLDQLNAR